MPRTKKTSKCYVMFGYKKTDPDITGYFGEDLNIVEDQDKAKLFTDENIFRLKGFGESKKWLEFINSDSDLNHGFKFHLVQTIKNCGQKG